MNQLSRFCFLAIFCSFFIACVDEPKSGEENNGSEEAVGNEQVKEEKTGQDLFNELKEKAVDANDIVGRLTNSAAKLEPILQASGDKVPAFKNATATIEEPSTLRLMTNENGVDKEYVVDLRTLDSDRIGLIPDESADDLPGVRLRTFDGAKAVKEYADGKLARENDELVIYLATRKDIENITPIIVQMLYLAQGRLE